MENVFVFVYPDKRYFEDLPHSERIISADALNEILGQYDKLIEARYRSRGFKIYWLAFSQEGQPLMVDRDFISDRVTICNDDQVISSGITLRDINAKRRMNADFVRKQLPEEISKLVLGGFHAGDCVSLLCMGLFDEFERNVSIDLDLTEFLMMQASCGIAIPTTRTGFSFVDIYGFSTPADSAAYLQDKKRAPWIKQRQVIALTNKEKLAKTLLFVPRRIRDLFYWLCYLPFELIFEKQIVACQMRFTAIINGFSGGKAMRWDGSYHLQVYLNTSDATVNVYGAIGKVGDSWYGLDQSANPYNIFSDESTIQKQFRFRFFAKRWVERRVSACLTKPPA